jgi:hypothetical protein
MNGACEIEGFNFTMPATSIALDRKARAAVAFVTDGAMRFGHDVVEHSLCAGSVDLSLVRTGRCPLLSQHYRTIDSLLGHVIAAEVHGPVMHCVARFARGPEADRLWDMLQDGFPLSLSVGGEIAHAVQVETSDGSRGFRVTRWKFEELSVVVFGKDKAAFMRSLGPDEDAATMVARMNADAGGARVAAVRNTLHLDEWEQWAVPTGVQLAGKLGVDDAAVCEALKEEVHKRCERFVADLAA